MYENIEFEDILDRMLDKIPSSFDKRQGSVIYDALAPAALELKLMYMELDNILNETFADTATRDYLIRRAAERGIKPQPATKAVLKGEFNIPVMVGSRFSVEELNYVVIEYIEPLQYKLECESLGVIGNKGVGNGLIPIEYIEGLETAKLTEILVPGEDEEDTEVLRERYYNSFKSKAYGGNISDYLEKTNSLAGVGSTKVTPIWDGPGTVKLTILDSLFNPASEDLIRKVQEKIDPGLTGTGLGVAPIGHKVTVETAKGVAVNITTQITFDEGASFESKQEEIKTQVADYLLSMRKAWSGQTNSVVRIAQIEAKILAVNGVLDINGTTINGLGENLTLTNFEVPIMGGMKNG